MKKSLKLLIVFMFFIALKMVYEKSTNDTKPKYSTQSPSNIALDKGFSAMDAKVK